MRIIVLVDNCVAPAAPLLGEHGFSALAETDDGRRYLFDTGRGTALRHNLAALAVPREPLAAMVLSHGHDDHTGGLETALGWFGPTDVIAHRNIFADHRVRGAAGDRVIAMPLAEETAAEFGARFRFVNGYTEIADGVHVTGEVPRKVEWEKGDEHLRLGGGDIDPISDDLSLVFEIESGLAVLLGCAHAGVVNILTLVRAHHPDRPVKVLLGGTHLGMVGKEQLDRSIEALADSEIEQIGLCHCTGLAAAAKIAEAMPGKAFFAPAGTVVEV